MENKEIFFNNLNSHRETAEKMEVLAEKVSEAGEICKKAIASGNKILFCGNGGSAADSQHLAAELTGRYLKNREPYAGMALHCDTSALTAIANDFSFDEIYARQITAHGREGDVLIAISTSGNSANIVKAVETAKKAGIKVIGMTGESGGRLAELADILLNVPSVLTPRIQEMHILIGHTICEMIEK